MQIYPSFRAATPAPTPPPQGPAGKAFGPALLDSAPRAALGVADGFVAGYGQSAPGLCLVYGAGKAFAGFLEVAGDNTKLLGEKHMIKGFGDLVSGVGLIAAGAGAGVPGVALAVAGDAMAAFGRLRESYTG